MSYVFPGREIQDILAETFGEGVLVTDEEFPVSETAGVTVEIEGEPEHFHVLVNSKHAVANILLRKLTERYPSLSVAVLIEWDYVEGVAVRSWATQRIVNAKQLPGMFTIPDLLAENSEEGSRRRHPTNRKNEED